MEQIYTIPVNEAFELVGDKPECGCPFCHLYRKLQEDEIEIILGASMMEPDIRIKTNEEGFCGRHYARMLVRKRMLGMGLIMQSHLAEVKKGRISSPISSTLFMLASSPMHKRFVRSVWNAQEFITISAPYFSAAITIGSW